MQSRLQVSSNKLGNQSSIYKAKPYNSSIQGYYSVVVASVVMHVCTMHWHSVVTCFLTFFYLITVLLWSLVSSDSVGGYSEHSGY